jgi:hypothetical protein
LPLVEVWQADFALLQTADVVQIEAGGKITVSREVAGVSDE